MVSNFCFAGSYFGCEIVQRRRDDEDERRAGQQLRGRAGRVYHAGRSAEIPLRRPTAFRKPAVLTLSEACETCFICLSADADDSLDEEGQLRLNMAFLR